MSRSTITQIPTPVLFELRTEDFERAAFFLRYAGFSVWPSDHPTRFIVNDTDLPFDERPKVPPRPGYTPFPHVLEIQSEDIIGAIQALNVGDFRVLASLQHPGRYEVRDAECESPLVLPEPVGA